MKRGNLAVVSDYESRVDEGSSRALADGSEQKNGELTARYATLQAQVKLLEQLVEISDAAHVEEKKRADTWQELHGLATGTATAWEDLYHGLESRGSATGLVVAVTATLAGATGYLLALAQCAAFVR